MLMKLNGNTFNFDHDVWTTNNVFNDQDEDEEKASCAKYQAFNDMPVQEIMLVDESKRYTILRLPQRMTLLQLFSRPEPTYLQYVEGEVNVIELIYGYQQHYEKFIE